MDNSSRVEDAQAHGLKLVEILRESSDRDKAMILGQGLMDELLKSLLDPGDISEYENLLEFLLANKNSAELIALIRYAITQNYSLRGVTKKGEEGYVSPSHIQWFEDGVMFLQGNKKFEGLIGLYKEDGSLSYAIAARDIRENETVGPDHLEFIDNEEIAERLEKSPRLTEGVLDAAIDEFESLLSDEIIEESPYQEWLEKYPWVLGMHYRGFHRHMNLDDRNIPDFTAVRVRDGNRDVIEVKPPFKSMFRSDNTPNAEFNDSWNQVERYVDFVTRNLDYLQRKGLQFDNPRGILILGYSLNNEQIAHVRMKERMNPLVQILTYDDLLVYSKSTVETIRKFMERALNESGT